MLRRLPCAENGRAVRLAPGSEYHVTVELQLARPEAAGTYPEGQGEGSPNYEKRVH